MNGLAEAVRNSSTAPRSGQRQDLRVWLRLLSCARLIEKRLRRNFQDQFDTTLPRFDVMATLDRAPEGLSMGALSRALLVSNGNVTAIVRQLHEQGLVDVIPDPADRRSTIASLSVAGKALFVELAEAHYGWVRDALSDFPEHRQEQLLDLLSELRASVMAND